MTFHRIGAAVLLASCAASAFGAGDALEDSAPWRLNAQITNVTQAHERFRAPYTGPNSLQPDEPARETTDVTLYAGWRIRQNMELWINPEIDQGFGLSNTLGVAGFPSGEAYKVGANRPYLRLPRAFVRYTAGLGGSAQKIDSGTNQFAGETTADNLIVTAGKFSVVDVFDMNTYAHDPRADFMNWAVIDAGTFDYAADPWGYTFGIAAEWTHGDWTLRGGAFQMSQEPNGKVAGLHPRQHMLVAELERRLDLNGHPGKIKLLAFANHANMASYDDAVQLAAATGDPPDVSVARHWQSRGGVSINVEQEIASGVGMFARAGANDGRKEAFEFTEINRTVSGGVSIKGERWSREGDTLGIAFAANGLSSPARRYFGAGGMGILIGDGALNYRGEHIVEAYYAARLNPHVTLAVDFQRIVNPAYNADRGPVSVLGARLHAEL